MIGTEEQWNALTGRGYDATMALWSLQNEMGLDVLDPSGNLQEAADQALADFEAHEFAPLMYTVVETQRQGDLRRANDDPSGNDWRDSTDLVIVRYRLGLAAELAGYDLDDAALDAMAMQIVTTAILTTASQSDRSESVDDALDPDEAVMGALGDEAAELYMIAGSSEPFIDEWTTEIDYVLPPNPTDTDLYIEAWIAARPGEEDPVWQAATLAWSFVVPDISVMNPASDNFSPVWTIVEIAGIGNPLDEVTGGARVLNNILGEAGEHVDELAAINRWADPDAPILGPARATRCSGAPTSSPAVAAAATTCSAAPMKGRAAARISRTCRRTIPTSSPKL